MQYRVKDKKPQKPRKRAPGAGRPKKDPNHAFSQKAYVAMTTVEKQKYELDARKQGLTLSFYLRLKLNLSVEGAIKPADQGEEQQTA